MTVTRSSSLPSPQRKTVYTGARPTYRFADNIGQYWPIADISVSVYNMFSSKC